MTKRKLKQKKVSKQSKKAIWFKRIMGLTLKLSIVGVALMTICGFYLNGRIQERFEKPLWDLPALVYSRILHLAPGESIDAKTLKTELDLLNYERVKKPQNPGEYSSSISRVEVFRRPFQFEDGFEPAQHVMVTFDDDEVAKITQISDRKEKAYLRIEPKMLGMLGTKDSQQRIFLPREQFPEFLIDALLTTEDRDFYHHDGIAPMAILRAMVANLRAGRTVQGGSTLTQQLAKNLFLTRERTLWRKVQEAYIALLLDFRYSKDKLLEMYLNEVYLGHAEGRAIHGFPLGARLYFGRPIEELRIDQLAFLVGLVKGPSYYNPWRFPERAMKRRDLVLRMMMDNNFISASQYENAASQSLDIQKTAKINSRQPAYIDQLSNEINDLAGEKFNRSEGLRVFTTLDPQAQEAIEDTVIRTVKSLEKKTAVDLEAAVVIADRTSGEILAMVGGSRPEYAGFNRALQGRRQIGSLSKPAVYLAALSDPEKYHLATPLDDKAISLTDESGQIWQPRNYDRKYRGEVPLLTALANSYNIPTVNIGMELGLSKVIDTYYQLGVDPNHITEVPSLLLGSFALTPLEVTQMYQTIGNGGRLVKLTALRSIVTQAGEVVYQQWPSASQTVSEQANWLTLYAMQQVVKTGTARFLNAKYGWAGLAGKTGTTDNNRDSWYVGLDGKEVVTVWIGRDDNQSSKLTGSSGALRLYADYVSKRPPTPLMLPRPAQLYDAPFVKSQGQFFMQCASESVLPIWDADNRWKNRCVKKPSSQQASKNDWLTQWFN